jgi:proline iminopeptidase
LAAIFRPECLSGCLIRSARLWEKHAARKAPLIDLSANTTDHLIVDIELLRKMLGIDRWLILGGSWGSTLALAYAERHIDRVSELVLFSVTTTAAWEIEWITEGVSIFFPEAWAGLRAGVPEAQRTGSLIED